MRKRFFIKKKRIQYLVLIPVCNTHTFLLQSINYGGLKKDEKTRDSTNLKNFTKCIKTRTFIIIGTIKLKKRVFNAIIIFIDAIS
jgi:hypothetical protein